MLLGCLREGAIAIARDEASSGADKQRIIR